MNFKKTVLASVVVTFVFLGCGGTENRRRTSNNERTTINSLGKEVFDYVKHNDYHSILNLLPDVEKYKELIRYSYLSEKAKSEAIGKIENNLKSDIQNLKSSYTRLVDKANRAGIDWSKTNLSYVDYVHRKQKRIESSDIVLNFTFKGVNYQIELRDCMKIGGVWYIGSNIIYKEDDSYNRKRYDEEDYYEYDY